MIMNKELLLLKIEKPDVFFEQIQTKPDKEIQLLNSSETFVFDLPSKLGGNWMKGLTSLEGHHLVFKKNHSFHNWETRIWEKPEFINKKQQLLRKNKKFSKIPGHKVFLPDLSFDTRKKWKL